MPAEQVRAPMTLDPLVNASHLIQVHVVCAVSTVVLGITQLVAPKGTIPHRKIGWLWMLLMGGMLITAFINHDLVTWDPFSPKVCCRDGAADCDAGAFRCASVQILAIYVLLTLPYAALQARLSIKHHRHAMLSLVLLTAVGGGFTLLPSRVLHYVFFGPTEPDYSHIVALMQKPTWVPTMTFSADLQSGMTSDSFSGSAATKIAKINDRLPLVDQAPANIGHMTASAPGTAVGNPARMRYSEIVARPRR